MPRFHDLTITDIHKTIRNAVVLTLQPDDPAQFEFSQGQYLTFRKDFNGTELRRSYSISAGKSEGLLQVGIKQVDGGVFSTWANNDLAVGDVLQSMAPMGNFHTGLDKAARKSYLAFAGGSGITPVISTLKTILATEPNSQFTLAYANQNVNSIMFREELEDLKNTYLNRLTLIHILERDSQNIDLFAGRIDAEKCDLLFKHWVDIASIDTAFICGPEPMMLAIDAALKIHGLTQDQIKMELFTAPQQGRASQPAKHQNTALSDGAQATITLDGATRSFAIDKNQSLLEAGLASKIDLPYSCKAGVCSSCRCKLTKGEVEMIANHALEDYEVEKGYILSCQSYPLTAEISVDYDQ